ncbi:hypothetical protein N7457_000462 [Penicillium paradoxum]|uniref:uncharacterized protein n=1 Tax=Penicillium paradoxum TaxID=176176 RepID=UPI002548B1BF|nr:uncharacterized protein N7457_000462 [Penicillium paradoxum]KAJ5793863.1 hypothetical protein N7457_000462 [Penicillium paradoxum]
MDEHAEILKNYKSDGYATNQVPRNPDYEIPDVVINSPYNRKIRVIGVGAGVMGILHAYYIQQQTENVEFAIYDKNPDIGGTWLENRYPGCACDVPSHAYQYPFALNPDWPAHFSYAADIWAYLDKVCEVWGLRQYMNFNSQVIKAEWDQEAGEWAIQIRQTAPDGTTKDFEDRCHVFLYASGILNNFKWPDIKGLEKFKGRVLHTARWPQEYQADQWKEERVAVIGSGASSLQTVPAMQPHVKHMDIFIRTGVWFAPIGNHFGYNHQYPDEQRKEFKENPLTLLEHAKSFEHNFSKWGIFMKGSQAQEKGRQFVYERMKNIIKDPRLLEGFTPKFSLGCRRITPGDPYMKAIQEPNVDVHFTAVTEITETGVIGADGIERECDSIICATGFDVTFRPRFPIIGKDGADLGQQWAVDPKAYMSIGVPGFPNFLMTAGPNSPVANGSVMASLQTISLYAMQIIRKLQSEYILSLTPNPQATEEFNEHTQEWARHTVWTDDCRSWYKDQKTGRVTAVWCGSALHYREALKTPRYEDYDIEYYGPSKKNRYAYLGMGVSIANAEQSDVSPWLQRDTFEPAWMRAVGMNRVKLLEEKMEELQKEIAEEKERVANPPVTNEKH